MGELKQGSDPYIGAIVWVRGETFKAESEIADLWQPKWSENQTGLAVAIHTPDRDTGPLEGAEARSWSLGIVEQSQGEVCCLLRRDELRGCEGGDGVGICWWRKAGQPWKQGDTAESRIGVGAITIASLSPHTPAWELNNRQVGPLNTWCTELQSRTPPRVLLSVTDAPIYRVGPQQRGPPLYLMHGITEKELWQGSSVTAQMGGTMEKDWLERPSDCQLQEARKKSLVGS